MTWSEFPLGDALKVEHGFAFKSEFFRSEGRLLVVTPGNFLEPGGFRVRLGKERYYVGDFPERYLLEKDDLVIAMTEQGEGLLGSAARIPADDGFLHNQRIGLVKLINSTLLEKKFAYWLFNSHGVRAQIRGSASGTKVRHTAPERVHKVRVRVPAVDSQAQIAALLDAYDNLIENNRRRIALLEESARLMYREWFVHLRFPDHAQVTHENGKPQGWRQYSFDDVVDAVGGATPSTARSDFWDGDVVWLTPTDVTRNDCLYLPTSSRKITQAGYDACSARLLPVGTIFMTSRASIGYFALMDQPACTNQGFISVLPKLPNSRNFFLFHLMSRVEEFEAKATGSTFKELSKKAFRDLTLLVPDAAVLAAFEVAVQPLIDQVINLKKQTARLNEARDALLPKLMSGEIAV